jgi:hypothetical protein
MVCVLHTHPQVPHYDISTARVDMSAIDDTTQNTTHKKKLDTTWCRRHVCVLGRRVGKTRIDVFKSNFLRTQKCRHFRLGSFTLHPSLSPYRWTELQRNEYTCFAWAGGTFFTVVLLCQFLVLAGNRFWFYILMYLEYNTVVVLC